MDKIKIYSYVNFFGKTSFLVNADAPATGKYTQSFTLSMTKRSDYALQCANVKLATNLKDELINISLVEFVELLKVHKVPINIINEVIKQCEEWEM